MSTIAYLSRHRLLWRYSLLQSYPSYQLLSVIGRLMRRNSSRLPALVNRLPFEISTGWLKTPPKLV